MFEILSLTESQSDDSVIYINYGPYEAHGIIAHRIQRLRGLIESLSNLGYELEISPVNLLNRVEIILCKRKIFQCDIRNLQFNMIYEDDPVCQRAVYAVEEAYKRMLRELIDSRDPARVEKYEEKEIGETSLSNQTEVEEIELDQKQALIVAAYLEQQQTQEGEQVLEQVQNQMQDEEQGQASTKDLEQDQDQEPGQKPSKEPHQEPEQKQNQEQEQDQDQVQETDRDHLIVK